jgi:hypothetical protein
MANLEFLGVEIFLAAAFAWFILAQLEGWPINAVTGA